MEPADGGSVVAPSAKDRRCAKLKSDRSGRTIMESRVCNRSYGRTLDLTDFLNQQDRDYCIHCFG